MPFPPIVFCYGLLDKLLIIQADHHCQLLDAEEKCELKRRDFRLAYRSAQYIYSRLLLKVMLSQAMRVSARSLSIRAASSGQPQLYISGILNHEVSLSVSHDRDQLFIAAGFSCRCGVDVQILHGVDWPAVMHAMGWLERIEQWLAMMMANHSTLDLNLAPSGALAWTAYEAWMKLTACTQEVTAFSWDQITLSQIDSVTHTPIFEMTLAEQCPYNQASILLLLRPHEVFAVATIEN
jgi:phosphopantetheinyl transferase